MTMLLNLLNKTLDQETYSSADQGTSIDISKCQTVDLSVVVDDVTPSDKTFDNGTSDVVTLTFPTKAGSTGGDYFVVYDMAGLAWAAALNKSGTDPVPSGAVYTAIAAGRKVNVDISGGTDAASVAALVETAFDALTGNPFVTDDSAADGTMLVTCTLHGNTAAPERHNANDSGNGSMGVAATTPGTASEVTVSVAEVSRITFETKAASAAGDYFVVYDSAGLGWAASVDKTGTDPEPTGYVWSQIPAARKAHVNISSATTAAQVAALFETAFDALSAVTITTDDSAANGTMLFSVTLPGATAPAVTYDATDATAGGLLAATITNGVTSVFNIPDHGLGEGLTVRLTSTGTLPTGLSTGTDYYIIVVDEDYVSFASSLANAQAGVAINVTNEGTSAGVNTVDVTALVGDLLLVGALQEDGPWFPLTASQDVTSETEFLFEMIDPGVKYIALSADLVSGAITADQVVLGKGLS